MAETRDLLVEIGTEELPPQALLRLSDAFTGGFRGELDRQGLEHGAVEGFATPRRLGILVKDLAPAQPDQQQTRRGPALQAAFAADGTPTRAAEGFARSCGVQVADLEQEETDKGAWLVHRRLQPGRRAEDLVPDMVKSALAGLPIPKRMRWGALESEFVRPVHWLVLLFGEQVIEANILDVQSGRETRGHRFHRPQAISISEPAVYPAALRDQGMVEPVFAQRRERIRTQTERAAAQLGAKALIEADLLDEVTALCEWPVAVVGAFDPLFLEVPAEALIETMQKNQKYFPLVNGDGRLLPNFITISNIESRDPEQVRAGNERVIRPRFKDAAFFWEQDLKRPLDDLVDPLGSVVFQNRLGSLLDKSRRIADLAAGIASHIGLDPQLAERAGMLSKCDLLTNMVGEFGSLQGIMGRYYATAAGEDPCVAAALEEHYLPRHAGDRLPADKCGTALALADRLDSLVGIFAVDLRPTGDKDPYALRRAALGVLRILIETPAALDLRTLLTSAADHLSDKVDAKAVVDEVLGYVLERLNGYYADQGVGGDVIDAVLATGVTVPTDLHRRIQAVMEFRGEPAAASLAAANKRSRNILRKADMDIPDRVDPALLTEDAEIRLNQAMERVGAELKPLAAAGDYRGALARLATLRDSVDSFFDGVMVMSDDPAIRDNRLALLGNLSGLLGCVADISRLQ